MNRKPSAHAIGTDLGGIRTVEDLRLRCNIDTETGCWHWRGAISRGQVSMRLPGLGCSTTGGTAICFLVTGQRPKPGTYWMRTCGCDDCVNPEHRKVVTKSRLMKARNFRHTQQTKAALAVQKARIPDEIVSEIRLSQESAQAMAERFGVHVSYVYRIRRLEARRPQVVSSVFTYRPEGM